MASAGLQKQIDVLEEKLAFLRELASQGAPALPEGFIVAEVSDSDYADSDYKYRTPDLVLGGTYFVVVPQEFGARVVLWGDREGTFVSSRLKKGGSAWDVDRSWAQTEEEAVLNFFNEKVMEMSTNQDWFLANRGEE